MKTAKPSFLLRPGWMFFLAALVYALYLGVQLGISYFRAQRDLNRIRHIVASEELILDLNDELRQLSRSAKNLSLPDGMATELFLDQVSVADAKPIESWKDRRLRTWHIGDEYQTQANELHLWQPLLKEVSYFETTKFYFIRGKFIDADLNEFVTDVGFKASARLHDGRWAGIKAKQEVQWRRLSSDDNQPSWKIARWTLKKLETKVSPQKLFSESLAEVVRDPNQLDAARKGIHQRVVNEFYRDGGQVRPWKYFTPISANQRPGISVVDVDRDGHDDLYVMVRRGRNQLFRNRGDGTFEEVARQWGLDVEHFCSCGIFADFDNDGDADLMLGRSFERSLYLENTGHRFERRKVSSSGDTLPYLVVSMSAADYNGDGLLDVYFSTYRPAVLESIVTDESEQVAEAMEDTPASGGMGSTARDAASWTDEFLSSDDARRLVSLAAANSSKDQFGRILDQFGPPNVLLVNRGGGKFEVAPESEQLSLWRNTLQSTWADFDEDGDPDLYVANDWAADHLLRNDGGKGFTDITEEMGTTEFGFAMGVSWGDYDRDGLQDIYVSNMYSKAGRRITAQIAELNPSYTHSVNGNYLYRNTPAGFQLVSGLDPPAITVAEAGWSWGGQFADFDNDGFLDLYVLSGYFSAPAQFASDVDL